ncbi:MAG: cell division protein FtsZ, partial [Alphaproteobacteria bacterium]|nr:cell division protein FtsZ [Alphaproteobacteria bacterium]
APSLFERLTGKVQEHLGNAPRADYDPQPQESRNFTPGPMTAPEAPSQGNLNIDRPAAAPERDGGDLDIPAFLRRQAN